MEHSGGFYAPISRPQTPLAQPTVATAASTTTPTQAAPVPVPDPITATTANEPAPALLPTSNPAASPTLDQELATVMKGIGSFWGKVRKQSVEVYQSANQQIDQYATTARKDLQPLVKQARANLDQLSESTKAELNRLSEAANNTSAGGGGGGGVIIGADGMPIILDEVAPVDKKGKGVDREAQPELQDIKEVTNEDGTTTSTTTKEGEEQTPAASAAAFFGKLQSQLASNPNVSQLSKNLSTLQHTVQNNLSTLPNSLQTNLNQLQTQFNTIDLSETRHTAEGYLHKSENWFNEFTNEVSKLAKDAVKVVPPNDVAREKKREEMMMKAEMGAKGRKEAMIQRLRSDPELLLVDPAKPPPGTSTTEKGGEATSHADTREEFSKYLAKVEDEGGFEGETFKSSVEKEKASGGEGFEMMLNGLVPGKMTKEAFWSRYFFRVGQIEEDERRRKAVLEVAADAEDDFSWDMEDEEEEESAPATTAPPAATTSTGENLAVSSTNTATSSLSSSTPAPSTPTPESGDWGSTTSSPTVPAPSHVSMEKTSSSESKKKVAGSNSTAPGSPRASSDGASSYDVVGAASGNPSEADPSEKVKEEKEDEDDGDDSDWE